MTRLVALLLLISGAAAAEPATVDPNLAQLQAAEAAVRAGRNTHPAIILNNRKTATPGEARPLTMPQGAPREFPLPPRSDVQPSAGNVQALIAASMAHPAPAPKPATGDADATAAGLTAITDFRRNHGVAR